MSDLRELYQQVIMDHNKKPRNFHAMENSTQKVEGFNPLCGDRMTLYMLIEAGIVKDISFEGSGCAISKASASMMTEYAKGRTVKEVKETFTKFHEMISRDASVEYDASDLGKLSVFSGVCEYPARVKCATLPWHSLATCLEGKNKTVTTE